MRKLDINWYWMHHGSEILYEPEPEPEPDSEGVEIGCNDDDGV